MTVLLSLAAVVAPLAALALGLSWGFGLGYERGRIEAVRDAEELASGPNGSRA